tara:strand:- start:3 stop:113 length:111 start_codon:yes stop_codon:yes gene_type:complete
MGPQMALEALVELILAVVVVEWAFLLLNQALAARVL